jgi:hypothetical protein
MTWLALADHTDRRFSLRGLGIDKRPEPICPDGESQLLERGSIVVETRQSPEGRPQVLFAYKTTYPNLRSLTFQAIPGGGISMVQVQGDRIAHAAIRHKDNGRADVLRIVYSWDCPTNWARLTLEQPESAQVISVAVENPRPLNLKDLRDLMLGREDTTMARDVIFAALSNQIEAIGPLPTLLPNTPLATPYGYKPAQQLRRGDTVLTQETGTVPVLHRVSRTVPARGSFAPVRLRAPYFGLQQDIIVAPDQRLMIDGPEVEYLFNQEAVLVPARHLVNGFAALPEPCGPTITYTQLLLPGHETMLAAGTSVESLYIGRLRRDAAHLASSVLHHVERNSLPEHGKPAHVVLKWFEAITLAKRRAA